MASARARGPGGQTRVSLAELPLEGPCVLLRGHITQAPRTYAPVCCMLPAYIPLSDPPVSLFPLRPYGADSDSGFPFHLEILI